MGGQEADMLENMKNACEAAALLHLYENQAFMGMDRFHVFGGFIREGDDWTGQHTLFRDRENGRVYRLRAVVDDVTEEWISGEDFLEGFMDVV